MPMLCIHLVDREREAIVIMIKLTTFDADALHRPVDREREAIVIIIKLEHLMPMLCIQLVDRELSDRDNNQTHNI